MSKLLFLVGMMLMTGNLHSQSDTLFDLYKILNDSELRLVEYKDSDNDLKLKLQHLSLINKSRQKYKAPEVSLDILASRVANKISKEAAQNNFTGHLNMAGEKPYHRYAFAGGKDHVSENAAGYQTSAFLQKDNITILELMKKMHLDFMSEKPSHDGHKENCIDENHNYVGIGFFINDHQFRYYEEYIDRYYTFESVPDTVHAKKEFVIRAKPQQGNYFYCLFAYYEKELRPMTPSAINRTRSYKDFTNSILVTLWPEDMAKYRKGEVYDIKLKFPKPGIYYIHIYQYDKEYIKVQPQSTSKGKLQASGIVIVAK